MFFKHQLQHTLLQPACGMDLLFYFIFFLSGTGKLVRIEGMMDGAKYREILEGNLLLFPRDLRLARRFTFQQDNDPKLAAKATLEWFKGNI